MTQDAINAPTIRVSDIIINENDEILLVKHRKKGREYWVLPGGHLEYGETFAECAERELMEETSLTGKFQKIIFLSESLAPDASRHIINIFALVKVLNGEIKIGSDEDILCEVAYKPLSALRELTVYPSVSEDILKGHHESWKEPGIRLLQTPWN